MVWGLKAFQNASPTGLDTNVKLVIGRIEKRGLDNTKSQNNMFFNVYLDNGERDLKHGSFLLT